MWAIKDGAGNLRGLSKLIRDVTEQKAMEDKIRHQSLHDPLTGLPNRRAFTDRLTLALSKARANNTMLALMSVDLDDFKRVNDTLGHDAGDILLQETASRLSSALRKGDSICRIGGDEFIILIDNVSRSRNIATRARNIRAVMKPPFDISNRKISISVSVGTSFYPSDGKSSRTLQKQADVALYNAKAAGKNCHKTSRDRSMAGKKSGAVTKSSELRVPKGGPTIRRPASRRRGRTR
jgi:diguanylate cyclase (GGDEF)-like protein